MRNNPLRVYTRYDEAASTGETNWFLRKLAQRLIERVDDTGFRVGVNLLIEQGDYLNLCLLELPYDRLSVQDAFYYGQIKAFFSKREDLDLGVDREAVASEKFDEAESKCSETNTIFKKRAKGEFFFRPCVESVLFSAQRKIARVLGDVPSVGTLIPRFGSGANTNIKKARACARNKLGLELRASRELLPFAPYLTMAEMPGWVSRTVDGVPLTGLPPPRVEVDVGVVEFVPKSWKTHRAIVKEPLLNTMWQLGVGDYIAKRLSRFGCDLKTGQDLNKSMAKLGSLTGELATLDLSSASDTVAHALVADLLPIDWYFFLRKLRTGTVSKNGVLIEQEKFSSMGNGFTFPLETLIFWAIAQSVSERAYVYGDDIIVETGSVPLLLEVLDAVGFIVNRDKSFWTGAFRESCGGDYLSGFDIRPCFVKNRLMCADLFVLHNYFGERYDSEVQHLIRLHIAKSLRIWGPDGFGDGHLVREDYRSRPFGRDRGLGGFTFDTYRLSPRTSLEVGKGDYVLPFYSVYVSSGRPEPFWSSSGDKVGYLRRGPKRGSVGSSEDRSSLALNVDAPPRAWTYDKEGRLSVTIPGTAGYKRISIYLVSGSGA